MKKAGGIAVALMLALCGFPPGVMAQQETRTMGSRSPEAAQFFLLGFVEESGTRRGILGWQGLVFVVREGDTVLGTYRVERLGDDVAILREGEREIRAPFRPKQPEVATLPPSLPGPMTAGSLSLPADQPPPVSVSPGTVAAPGGATAGVTGAGGALTTWVAMPGSAGSATQSQDDNPFARALRERAQQRPSSASPDNPFASGTQPGSSASAPGDNPFLRALRERGSAPPSTQDNPFLRALRERGY